MRIEQFMEAIEYRVSGGSSFDWETLKERNIRYIDFEDVRQKSVGNALVASDGEVLEITIEAINSEDKDVCLLWREASFEEEYIKEALERNVDPDNAWENVQYTHMKTEDDMLVLVSHLIRNDTSIQIQEEELLDKDEQYFKKLAALLNVDYNDMLKAQDFLEDCPDDFLTIELPSLTVIELEKIAFIEGRDPDEFVDQVLNDYLIDYKNFRKEK